MAAPGLPKSELRYSRSFAIPDEVVQAAAECFFNVTKLAEPIFNRALAPSRVGGDYDRLDDEGLIDYLDNVDHANEMQEVIIAVNSLVASLGIRLGEVLMAETEMPGLVNTFIAHLVYWGARDDSSELILRLCHAPEMSAKEELDVLDQVQPEDIRDGRRSAARTQVDRLAARLRALRDRGPDLLRCTSWR
jgi:hypothetical protein